MQNYFLICNIALSGLMFSSIKMDSLEIPPEEKGFGSIIYATLRNSCQSDSSKDYTSYDETRNGMSTGGEDEAMSGGKMEPEKMTIREKELADKEDSRYSRALGPGVTSRFRLMHGLYPSDEKEMEQALKNAEKQMKIVGQELRGKVNKPYVHLGNQPIVFTKRTIPVDDVIFSHSEPQINDLDIYKSAMEDIERKTKQREEELARLEALRRKEMEAIKDRHVERLKELTYLQELLKRQSKLRELIDKEGKNIQLEKIIGGMTDTTEFRNSNDSLHVFVEPFDVVNLTQNGIPIYKFSSLADKDNSYLITHQVEQDSDKPLGEGLKLIDDEINRLYAKLNIPEGERPRRVLTQNQGTPTDINEMLNNFEQMESQLHSLKEGRSNVVNDPAYDDKLNKIQNDLAELEDYLIKRNPSGT